MGRTKISELLEQLLGHEQVTELLHSLIEDGELVVNGGGGLSRPNDKSSMSRLIGNVDSYSWWKNSMEVRSRILSWASVVWQEEVDSVIMRRALELVAQVREEGTARS